MYTRRRINPPFADQKVTTASHPPPPRPPPLPRVPFTRALPRFDCLPTRAYARRFAIPQLLRVVFRSSLTTAGSVAHSLTSAFWGGGERETWRGRPGGGDCTRSTLSLLRRKLTSQVLTSHPPTLGGPPHPHSGWREGLSRFCTYLADHSGT